MLTEFTYDELQAVSFEAAWEDLLRVQAPLTRDMDVASVYLFTKGLHVKMVRIVSCSSSSADSSIEYFFYEHEGFDLRTRLPYIDHLYSNGITGVAVYSAPDMTLLRANQIYLNFLDEPYRLSSHSIGRSIYTIVSGFRGSEVEQEWLKILETGKAYDIKEMPYTGYARGITYWNTTTVPIYENGEIKYLAQAADEITEVVRSKQQLEEQSSIIRQQKLELEAIINHMSDAVYIVESNGTVNLMNEEAKRKFPGQEGLILGDALQQAEFFYQTGERIPEGEYPIHRAFRGETIKNFTMIVRMPHYEYVTDLSAVPIYTEDQQVDKVIVCSHNITELIEHRNHLERLVQERTQQLSVAHENINSILESVTDGFFALNKEWEVIYVNEHLCRAVGQSQKELLHHYLWEIYPQHVPNSIYYKKYNEAMNERKPVYFDAYNDRLDKYYEIRVYPYHDGICVFLKDITDKKKYEGQFKRLSQLDLIGQMAAGISHEVRNPMTAVRGFLQLLSKNDDFLNYTATFNLMIEELDRANAIVSEFLSMGSNRLHEQKQQSLNDIISGIAPLIQADALTQHHFLELDLQDTPDLPLNHNEIRQLILNLSRNGLEAMTMGKKLTIRTYADREHVTLIVQDEGNGIHPEIMDRVGTPFFTTKDNGTGLGLGVCHGIAARHNATLELLTSSEGTQVLVRFRIQADAAARS